MMDATAWTVVGAAVAILAAIATAFRSLRREMRLFREHVDERVDAQRERIDAQGEQLCERIDAQGEQLRERIDAQGEQLRERIDAQGRETGEQISQLRERMAHLEGLLEGLREAITGQRAA